MPRARAADAGGGRAVRCMTTLDSTEPRAVKLAAALTERALIFECEGDRLVGVLATPVMQARTGVVIVVGGPQYRAGSHRQFVLLARALAAAGFAVLRFDYRGMGDSEGAARPFEDVSVDIAAAIGALRTACPSVEKAVLWGLCDGASAALMHVASSRAPSGTARDGGAVSGLVLVNPWLRSDATYAKTQIRHYYLRRVFDPAFWGKLLRGRVRLGASMSDLRRAARTATAAPRAHAPRLGSFQQRMLEGFASFSGPALVLMSGRDLTAREFDEFAAAHPRWRELLRRSSVSRQDFPDADHTFSAGASHLQAERATVDWLRQCFDAGSR